MAEKTNTVIAEGTEFQGSLISKCDVTMNGRFDGELTAPGLSITTSGSVGGEIQVDNLDSQGKISGNVKAKNVRLAGTVDEKTTIQAETLEVKLATPGSGVQITFGDCHLKVGEPRATQSDTAKPHPQKQKVGL